MWGGAGNDVYYVDNASDQTNEAISAANTADATGTDLVYSSVARILGNYLENLTLTGTAAINGTGNALANALRGNSDANTLTGNAGNDTLDGGAGNDALTGGTGKDSLTGGLGSDVFYFKTYSELGLGVDADIITDFSKVQLDKIDFSLLDAKLGTTANDSFKFLAVAPTTTSNANGALWYSNGILYGSNDTDVAAEFQIYVDLIGIVTENASTYIVL
jgi:Ca2+-binding RTX toxin-like protein